MPAPATHRRRALVVFNHNARLVRTNAERVVAALRSSGLSIVRGEVTSPKSAADLVRAHAADVDLVVGVGGDGTLNAILQGLVDTRLPLGVVPLGTANDLCKSLGIPLDVEGACKVIAGGVTRRIDVGRVNGVHYFLEASIGLSVALCRCLDRKAKSRFGVLAHVWTAFSIMRRMRRFTAFLKEDDGPEVALSVAQLTVGNSTNFGGLLVNDEASIDDRKLDLYAVRFKHWWTYFQALIALLRRRYDEGETVFTIHAKRFEVRTRRPMQIEADGEIVSKTPAVFEARGGAVKVLVPGPAG